MVENQIVYSGNNLGRVSMAFGGEVEIRWLDGSGNSYKEIHLEANGIKPIPATFKLRNHKGDFFINWKACYGDQVVVGVEINGQKMDFSRASVREFLQQVVLPKPV